MRLALSIAGWIVLVLLVGVLVAAAWFARPLGKGELASKPSPADDYEEAVRRIDEVEAAEAEMPLQPVGRSYALLHPSRTETAVVVFHGYTDVTDQFSKVAQGYYDAGFNVWVPRMPFHGHIDRMTNDQSKITAEVLRQAADANIDIATGLGHNVEVIGLSGGGALSVWAAAERPDVTRTVIISPLMLPHGYKPWMVRPLARLVAVLPDSYSWWTEKQAAEPGPEYPRYSRRGITAYLMMAERAKAHGAKGARPVRGDVVVVSNLADTHLDTTYPIDVMRPLVREDRSFRSVVIPASEGLPHDFVAANGENAERTRVAYRYLSEAIGIPLPDPLGLADAKDKTDTGN